MIKDIWLGLLASLIAVTVASMPAAAQQQRRPNILVIMGDDVGGLTSVPTIAESCRERRQTSTSWRLKA
jgi:hypothetical protein